MKDEVVSKIILAIADESEVEMEKLRSKLYLAVRGYSFSLKNTELVLREENKNDWFFQKFIMAKTVRGCSERTIDKYTHDISRILKHINKSTDEITSDDILYYIAIREKRDKLSKVTLNSELRAFSSFLSYLFLEGLIPRNAVKQVGKLKEEKKQKKAFTELEVAKLKNACETVKEKAVIEMLFSTGCRATELASIKLVNIDNNRIVIQGKGNKERTVYLNATAMLALEGYRQEKPKLKNPYLFPKMKPFSQVNKKGINRGKYWMRAENFEKDGHMSTNTIQAICKNVGARAEVEDVHPHRFRRTCATMALKRGMPIEQVSKMLGHEEISTTQIYLDLNERDLEMAHEKYVV